MALSTSRVWLAIRVAAWVALALFGVWLGVAIKMYWVVAVFVGIALLGGALELTPRRGSRTTSIQAGIIVVGLFALMTIAAIAGVAIIADELQGMAHRPRRFHGRLIYDPASDALGSAGGALFWILCFGASLVALVHYLRKFFGKGKPNAT